MEPLLSLFAEYGQQLVQFVWLPLLIWTVAALVLISILPLAKNLHPQYHYHLRLAALFALPAGFAAMLLTDWAGSLFTAAGQPENVLKIITVAPPMEIGVTAAEPALFSPLGILFGLLFIVIITGSLFMLMRFLIQSGMLISIRSKCPLVPVYTLPEADPGNKKLALSAAQNLSIGFIQSEIIPVTFGIRKPVILVPQSLRSSPEKLNLVLRHEILHIRERDFLANVVVNSVKILFWFHPLVHLLARRLSVYREMRCDALVLSDQSVSRKAYASLLLELVPKPNLETVLSVHMARESSNLKTRIHMITQQTQPKPVPQRTSSVLFAVLLSCCVIAMACTDMQTDSIFNEEELNLMTLPDLQGERGYHQILILLGEDGQTEIHEDAIKRLQALQGPIYSIVMLQGEEAAEQFGERAKYGAIQINTRIDSESYNSVLKTLGMEPEDLDLYDPDEAQEYYTVVEQMPKLIGGLAAIAQEITYPEMARRAGIEGRVYVQFIVNEQGEVEHPRILRGIGGGADEEALRVISNAEFEPGYQDGKPVAVQYSIPIVFRLPNQDS